jgi:hypothetical protein
VLSLFAFACDLRDLELAPNAPTVLIDGDVPSDVIARFASDTSAPLTAKELSLSAPSDGAMVPENLAPMTLAWQVAPTPPAMPAPPAPPAKMPKMPMAKAPKMDAPAMGAPTTAPDAVFELRVRGPYTELRVYTRALRYVLPRARWEALLQEARGGSVSLGLRRLTSGASGPLVAAQEVSFAVAGAIPRGGLYYMSSTIAGIKYARIEDSSATQVSLLSGAPSSGAPAPGARACVGCHAISRDGRHLAAGLGPGRVQSWRLDALKSVSASREASAESDFGYAALDPTGVRLAYAYAGSLKVFAADTGALLIDRWLSTDVRASYPDWSPDGRSLLFTRWSDDAKSETMLQGSGLARASVLADGTLADVTLVRPAASDETLRFASTSPDGQWVAFESMKGPDEKNATLQLVDAAFRMKPVTLQRAVPSGTQASMPSWLPGAAPGEWWLAFTSSRDVPGESDATNAQLWLTHCDVSAAADGRDPSAPAVHLPFQGVDEDNRRALFAAD